MHVLLQRVRKCKCLRGELHVRRTNESVSSESGAARSFVRWFVHSFNCMCSRSFFVTIETYLLGLVWLDFFSFACIRLVLCVFGVLQMDGNKSAKAYINTCDRDILAAAAAMGAFVVMECDTQLMHSCNVHCHDSV